MVKKDSIGTSRAGVRKGDSGNGGKPKIDPAALRRNKKQIIDEPIKPVAVSAGPVEKVMEYALNPSRDKVREVTVIDRLQGRYFPLLDLVNTELKYVMEVATFRQNRDEYKRIYGKNRPEMPDHFDEFLYRTAQWQKSVAGKNVQWAMDMAMAELESKAGMEDESLGADAWKE